MDDSTRFRTRSRVLAGEVAGEALLVDQEHYLYFGLDEVGTAAWQRLQQGASVDELVDHLLELFEVDEATLRRDLEGLLRDLQKHRLVEPVAD